MSRFPVDEVFWRRTEDSELVSFGRNYSVLIVEPGTDDPLVLWSEEAGGVEVAQPLTTDVDGRALGKDGVRPWSDTADYDVIINGERYPKRAPAGGGGGGAVDSVIEELANYGKGYIDHGEDAEKARPSGIASIEWHGPAEPENAIDGDTWFEA